MLLVNMVEYSVNWLCLDCSNEEPANLSPIDKAGRAQFWEAGEWRGIESSKEQMDKMLPDTVIKSDGQIKWNFYVILLQMRTIRISQIKIRGKIVIMSMYLLSL